MQVSATTYGQKITLNQNKITIKEVFKEIKRQTGYDVLWQPEILNANKTIDVNFNKASVKDVIAKCIAGKDMTFEIEDSSVVIKQRHLFLGEGSALNIKDSVNYKGTVYDENGKPLAGATVRIKGSRSASITTELGNFVVFGPEKTIIVVSYLGYVTKEINTSPADANRSLKIMLSSTATGLGEVSIVSTGYQDVAKERATGSFELITKEQLQHSTDPNLLKRLEGITTSMDFRNDLRPTNSSKPTRSILDNLTIRGKNTLEVGDDQANNSGKVLVVIDGIASPYSIDQVNPNDVESISILKDAAASSIWGSRAANGVIVVKTKKGSYETPLQVSFNSNVNITEKMDLFYKKYMSVLDFIDAQIFQFNTINTTIGDPSLNVGQLAISPVADILNQQKRGLISSSEANQRLDDLRKNDIRNDYSKYILREAVTQSYSLALSGGTKGMAWRLSGGYDHLMNNTVKSGSNRTVLNYGISIKPLPKLELQANLIYNHQNLNSQSSNGTLTADIDAFFYPYTKLADDEGNALEVTRTYSPQFIRLLETAHGDKILSYRFKPLENINYGYNKTKSDNFNVGLNSSYKILPSLLLNVAYNYNFGSDETVNLDQQNSYYTRDLINRYTNPTTFAHSIPLGAIYQPILAKSNNGTLRGQLSFNKTWQEKHNISAIAGVDIGQTYRKLRRDLYYGYDENTLSSTRNLDFKDRQRLLFGDPFTGVGLASIPMGGAITESRSRTVSHFTNFAYSYDSRYTLSASLRRDFSSIYGIKGNSGATPFYSIGTSWNINNEGFYDVSWLPYLKLRATFGYNGNANPGATADPLINYTPADQVFEGNLLAYGSVRNPTNSALRPEKTGIFNFGLDFGVKDNRLSGSIEYYEKRTKDLLTENNLDPSTGFSIFTTNTGNLRGWGTDITLNSLNIKSNLFRWNSNLLFSYNRVKVTRLNSAINRNAGELVSNPFAYSEGYDLSRAFAFQWAGLDPNSGAPRAYLNGNILTISNDEVGSEAYRTLFSAPASSIKFLGSIVPVYYGSLRNTFSYGGISMSVNLMYKLHYWFRRPLSDIVQYTRLYQNNKLQGAEYVKRWQKPGDETITNVPALIYPGSGAADQIYQYSDINILKGDHIRLQEINLSYSVNKKNWFIKNPRIYANVSNLGIIWRANKLGLDPDINDYPAPRTYSLGFSTNF